MANNDKNGNNGNNGNNGKKVSIRKPAVSGLFYPSKTDDLHTEVSKYIEASEVKTRKKPWGLIVPHAGYKYSGIAAGYAYATVKNKVYENVLIMAPSHYAYFKEGALIKANYTNSLGTIETNFDIVNKLAKHNEYFIYYPEAHYHEHSIEVQLPFLQTALKSSFKLIPIILSNANYTRIEKIVDIILENVPVDKTLFIASSDLSHYHDYDEAKKLDAIALEYIEKGSSEEFYKAGIERKFEACGFIPITALLMIGEKTNKKSIQVLFRNNSGDIIPDKKRVVGYSAIALFSK